MRKNIGLLISTLNGGGAERVVSRLSYILKDDYNLFIILFDGTNIKYEYNGKLINLNIKPNNGGVFSKLLLLIKRVYLLQKCKKNNKLDLVISFLDSPNLVNILSVVNNCKTILSVRNYLGKEKDMSFLNKIINFVMKKIYKHAAGIISVSKQITELLKDKYEVKEEKIKTIYNPVNTEMIEKLANEPIEEEYKQFMNSDKIFISVGRQSYQKGYWHLLKAFKLVHEKDPETKLVIIGRDENNNVQSLISDLGLNESVLLTGYNKNPFKFIKNSSIYVLSSIFEGFPNALVEAMACGCPIIASDCKSGPKEILCSNPNLNSSITDLTYTDFGVLVPAMDPREDWSATYFDISDSCLANAMLELLNNKDKLQHYSIKALQRAQSFNYDRCRNEFKSLIESII